MISIYLVALLGAATVRTSPPLISRQAITALSTAQIDAFAPYTYFAKAAYCNASATRSWTCGIACDANSDFQPVASGGDGNDVQYWYVGYKPSLDTVIVAHQGTDPSQIFALLTDAEFFMGNLNSSLFPGLSSDIEVHDGFHNEQAKTATTILSNVQSTMSQYRTNSVTMVGHSLGAAISLLDSVYLPLHISGATFQTYLYGLPRVGNKAFADYVDANLRVTHVNNMKDPVPIIPGRFLGYVHPSGEVHIREDGQWVACPGQDDKSTKCTIGDVPNIFESDLANHLGPYNGIMTPCLESNV